MSTAIDVTSLLSSFATEDDDQALSDLARSVPMRGSISYVIERDPSFLAMTRAQGASARVGILKEPSGRVVAAALGSPRLVFLNGAARSVLYVGDFKVRSEYRKRGVAGIVARTTLDAFGDQSVAYGSVLLDNDAVARFFGRSTEFVRFHPVATVANETVFFGRRRPKPAGIRRATCADAPRMVELFTGVHVHRHFAPVLDTERPVAALTPWPGMTMEDYVVLERHGRIVAFAGVWDAYATKRVRLLSLSTGLRGVRFGYNLLARGLGRALLPADGEHLRFVYVTAPCAERAEDLHTVLRAIEADHGHHKQVYFDIAFDERDPLRHALEGFARTRVLFRIAMLTWGAHLGKPPSLDGRPVYFDAALV